MVKKSWILISILNFFVQILNDENLKSINLKMLDNIPNNTDTLISRHSRSNMSFGIKERDNSKESKSAVTVRSLTEEELQAMPKLQQRTSQSKPKIVKPRSKRNLISLLDDYFNEQILIYRTDSGIISSDKIEELLNPQEKDRRKSVRERFKRALKVEQIHFTFPKRDKKEKGVQAILVDIPKSPFWTSPLRLISGISNLKNRRSPDFPTNNQQLLLEKLDQFPVFTVENNLRQLILANPPEVFMKNLGDKLYDWYYRIFEWEKDTRATSIGFFFFNPEDAYVYQDNIREFGALSASELGTSVVPCRLSQAYKYNRTSPPETRFMLIPDVKEVGDLITHYRHKYGKKMQIHHKQEITRDGFANQPIYIIQDIKIRTGLFSTQIVKYQGEIPDNQYLFFSLEGAELAWDIFRKSKPNLRLPKKPNILLYNFNSFIADYEADPNTTYKNFLLVPNRETFDFINLWKKQEADKGNLRQFYDYRVAPHIFFIKLWANRFKLVLFHAPRINEYPRRELLMPQTDAET